MNLVMFKPATNFTFICLSKQTKLRRKGIKGDISFMKNRSIVILNAKRKSKIEI